MRQYKITSQVADLIFDLSARVRLVLCQALLVAILSMGRNNYISDVCVTSSTCLEFDVHFSNSLKKRLFGDY